MDKYDEIAYRMTKHTAPSARGIATAMREAAAEAYEDAAQELWGPGHAKRLLDKAASLRGVV